MTFTQRFVCVTRGGWLAYRMFRIPKHMKSNTRDPKYIESDAQYTLVYRHHEKNSRTMCNHLPDGRISHEFESNYDLMFK